MRKKFFRTVLVCILVIASLSTSAAAITIGGATVTASALNLRSEPSTLAQARMLIPNGGFLLVEERSGDWYKAVYNGVEGYVAAEFVDFAETKDGLSSFTAAVRGSFVRLRSGASTSSSILANMNTGTQLNITGVSGAWIKVLSAAGNSGYVHSDYLDYVDEMAEISAASSRTTGQQMVDTAMQYLGYPYVWGGMSPSGFDCSGFVNYICDIYDYDLYRVAQDIYNNDGSYVDKSALQPGDLVFFGYSAYGITHVGMYIGNGQFIHASTSTTGVIISELGSNYYTNRYVGAKRIA